MLVKRFLAWSQSAPPDARAGATAALARAWLGEELDAFENGDAVAALTLTLDDPDIVVRRALAEVFAGRADAPRHIVVALAGDVPDVAIPVLLHSPLLDEPDLVEWAATRAAPVQCAIAARRQLQAPVAAALAEVGEPEAAAILARNPEARIPGFSLARMAERFAGHADVAQALLERGDLTPMARFCLLTGVGQGGGETDGRTPGQEQLDRAAVSVASGLRDDDLAALVAELRRRGVITASLMLRALASGELPLFQAVLTELSRLPRRRVAALVVEGRGSGFPALCRKVGLPEALIPVLRSGLVVLGSLGLGTADIPVIPYSPSRIVALLLQSDAVAGLGESHAVKVALRRLEAEFARDEGRRLALALAPPASSILEPLQLEASMMVSGGGVPALVQDNAPRPAAIDTRGWPAGVEDQTGQQPATPPSFSAMAALLEETVAAALANLPPPKAPREERDAARAALVIEGEWVGVAVGDGFDPGQFQASVAA